MNGSVLVIDDDESFREVIAVRLELDGYAPEPVADGESGISRLRARNYALVITDLDMPGVNGVGVVRAVKERSPQTPVIVLTGSDDLAQWRAARQAGAFEVLAKGCDRMTLRKTIDRAMEAERK